VPSSSPASPIGAHVSVAGGLLNAVANAREAACEAFQVWVSSARAWKPPTLDPAVDHRFREQVAEAGLGPVFVHAAYLVNLASTSQATFDSSVAAVAATLDKAAALGAAGVVVHAGSHLGAGPRGRDRPDPAGRPAAPGAARRPPGRRPDLLFELTAGTRNASRSTR
jgi:deoxyribonuclease-4